MSENQNNEGQPVAQPVTTDASQAKDSVEAEPVQSESDVNKDSSASQAVDGSTEDRNVEPNNEQNSER